MGELVLAFFVTAANHRFVQHASSPSFSQLISTVFLLFQFVGDTQSLTMGLTFSRVWERMVSYSEV